MPAHSPLRISRALRRLIVCCLALALPLCGLSASLVELLGVRHLHRAEVVADAGLAGMAGWQDFRRSGHHGGAAAHASAHSHGFFDRHHHERTDDSVLALDRDGATPGSGEGDAVSTAIAALVFAPVGAAALPGPADATARWPQDVGATFSSRHGGRLERPPRA